MFGSGSRPPRSSAGWIEAARRSARSMRRVARAEDGNLSIFAIFMFLGILALGGVGIDFMHSEIKRVKLQNTLDRAILAAADLDQAQNAEAVVADYFAKAGLSDALASTSVDQGINFRTVSARADMNFNPLFLHLVGVDTMEAVAAGTATERVNNVEISLVLDISGSMANNSKLRNMQDAAKTFVDSVINERTQDLVSVSLIPYSEHVNAGEEMLDAVNTRRRHEFDAFCVEFKDSEFNSTEIDTDIRHVQAQHYQWNYNGWQNSLSDTVCPRYEYEEIRPFSQNAAALKDQIDDLRPRAGTSIFLGMKWAAGMLDPSFRTITQELVSDGIVDGAFNARPALFTDTETLKVIVLMTDGENDRSYRITESIYDGNEYHWGNNNLWHYLNRKVSSWYRSYYYYQKYDASTGDRLLENICEAAKDRGIVVWSIGFEVEDRGAGVMRDCASSPSHFFRVEGTEIEDAFSAVAQQINQLKLTE